MQGSINFDGSLVGNITGGGGGGGDTVVITPVVTSGTKIADVSVNGVEKDLYCPTPPTPPEIDITPVVTSGTKIADVTVDGVEKDLYCPTPPTPQEVIITPVVTEGTKIADISIDGVEKDLFCPIGDRGSKVYYGDETPLASLGENGDIYAKTTSQTSDMDILLSDIVVNQNNVYMPFEIDVTGVYALVIETLWETVVKNIADIPPYADTNETKTNIYDYSQYYSCGISRIDNTFYFYSKSASSSTNTISSVSKRIRTYIPSNVDSIYFKLANNWIEYNPNNA